MIQFLIMSGVFFLPREKLKVFMVTEYIACKHALVGVEENSTSMKNMNLVSEVSGARQVEL